MVKLARYNVLQSVTWLKELNWIRGANPLWDELSKWWVILLVANSLGVEFI